MVARTFCELHKIIFYEYIIFVYMCVLFVTVPLNRKMGEKNILFCRRHRRFLQSTVRLLILDELLYLLRLLV